MILSPNFVAKIEQQFDQYYFQKFQSILVQNDNANFRLQHRLNGISAKMSMPEDSFLEDEEFLHSLNQSIQNELLIALRPLFHEDTTFTFETVVEGSFQIHFQNSLESGMLLLNSSSAYFFLMNSNILFTIQKEETIWNLIQYFSDGTEFFPIGQKQVVADDFDEAIIKAQEIPYEEMVPTEEVIRNTLRLYHIAGLKEILQEPKISNQKTYYLTQQ